MDCTLPGSSIHGIFQARILGWVAISFSWWSSWPRDWTQVSHTVGKRFYCLSHQGSLNRFNSTNKINNYNTRGGGKVKGKRKSRSNYRKSQNIRINRCFSLMSAVSVLSLAGRHCPPHLPRTPSNTRLDSGPAVGTVHTLIWSYSCVFLPPMSTVVKTSVFSFVGTTVVLLYIP